MLKLDIIIINWNSGKLLENCIKSIVNTVRESFKLQIIVVDNASIDDSLSFINKSNLPIKLIKNKENVGFARACNQALRYSKGNYILFLNPDTILKKDTLYKAIDIMESNPDISVLGCKQVDENGNIIPSCSRFPKLINYIYDILGLSKIWPKTFKPATIMIDWDHKDSRCVDHVMGSFMLIRRDVLKKVGNFDERFFVYLEDLDLSKRIIEMGGKIFYSTDLEIYHEGGGTSKKVKDRRLYYSLKSRIRYGYKHFKKIDAVLLFILTIVFEPFTRLFWSIIRIKLGEIKIIIKAYIMLYSDFVKGKLFYQ